MALTRLGLNQSINLATNVTGTLATGNGGTGATSFAPGKILQAVTSINTYGSQSSTSTSYFDMESASSTTWETSITPSATSSKILILFSSQIMGTGNAQEQRNMTKLLQKIGSNSYTDLTYQKGGIYNSGAAVSIQPNQSMGLIYLSSPSTTSACTYKLQLLSSSSSVTIIPNHGSYSTCVLMEVAG
jgi:hypothetical protein